MSVAIKDDDIAKVAYEVDRAYRSALGEKDIPEWDKAPSEMKKKMMEGVAFRKGNQTPPNEIHNNWILFMTDKGWKYGETYNEEEKTHPNMIPFSDLPEEQKAKDHIFGAIVNSLAAIIPEVVIKEVPAPPTTAKGRNMDDFIPVKYIGKRDRYKDSVFGSNLTFEKGQTLAVHKSIAPAMLKHVTVYEAGNKKDIGSTVSATVDVEEKKNSDPNSEENKQLAIDTVLNMKQKKPIVEFAKRNFSNIQLDEKKTVRELQDEAINMIHQYGLVG